MILRCPVWKLSRSSLIRVRQFVASIWAIARLRDPKCSSGSMLHTEDRSERVSVGGAPSVIDAAPRVVGHDPRPCCVADPFVPLPAIAALKAL